MQTNEITAEDIDDLTLAVLYLTAWRESITDPNGETQANALINWKGHSFDSLDSLAAKHYTDGNRRNKSVQITEAGEAKAQEVIQRLLGKSFTVSDGRKK